LLASREKIGRPCDSCAAYESQLRGAHDNEKTALAQLNSMQRQLDMERQAMDKQQKYTIQLENALQTSTAETEKQVCSKLFVMNVENCACD
jgi:Rab GTPase-binding effector protein 1